MIPIEIDELTMIIYEESVCGDTVLSFIPADLTIQSAFTVTGDNEFLEVNTASTIISDPIVMDVTMAATNTYTTVNFSEVIQFNFYACSAFDLDESQDDYEFVFNMT